MKYVHGEQESYWNDVGVVLVNFLLTIDIFHNFFRVFIVDFEQVYVCAYFKTFIPNPLFDIKTYFLRQYEKC